jgi:hypothetical protein
MVRASRTLPICLLVLSVLFSISADAALVKKSNSGLCHPPQSSWYERTKNYRAFDSLEACQDSRAEALIAQSTTRVRFADESRCRVVTGRWISPFTGKVIQNSSEIDVDHVVPLKWAWDRGARTWSRTKRETFANDPVNLWPVELSLNRSKGAKGPDEWLPPSAQWGYVARFFRVVKHYDLKFSSPETRWIKSFLDSCRN